MVIKIYKIRRIFSVLSIKLIITISIFCFTGCNSARTYNHIYSHNNISVPEWVYHPSTDNTIGGVGISGTHVKGVTGQRELATQRALEDIARQLGVDVNSVLVVDSKSNINVKQPSSTMHSISSHKTQKNIKAYIKEVWVHPISKEMYVYMIAY